MRAVRVTFWINLFLMGLLTAACVMGDPLHSLLGLGLGLVFFFPILEGPMLAISIWGIVKDRQWRSLYVVTALLMFGGLLFAFANRNTPLP